jgi:hypothetical protein
MKQIWNLFDGIRPRLRPQLLAEAEAQRALNTKLWSGAAEPFKATLYVQDLPAGTKTTIFRHGQSRTDENYWFAWNASSAPNGVDIVRGPVAGDTQERVYWTGDGVPKVTDASIAWASAPYPSASYTLGLPAPSAATISSPGGTGTATRISLVYVYVSAWGETGPPSAASNLIDYFGGETLTVTGLDGAPSGAYNTTNKYLYIASTDANGTTAFRFWKQVTVATTSTTGTVDFSLLGEAISSPSLIQPPSDLFGLRAHPGGFLVGCTTRRFCRSEVFKPYGWPTLYQDPLPDDIVGVETLGSGTVVCTKGKTYLFTGSDPLNQYKNDLEGWQPCVSKRAIARTTSGVLYPSADGLVLVGGGGPLNLVTANHISREQWQAYRPESSHAAVHDDRYYWWWDNGTTRGLLIFELGGGGVQQIVESDIYATAAFADHRKDDLYVAAYSTGHLHKWDSGASNSTMVWRSKLFHLDRPQNVGAVRIEASGYPVTFRLYSGDTVVNTVSVTSDRPQTLRGDRRYKDFFVEVEAAHRIETLTVASSILDMR